MIWYDLLEESQCQEQQFDRSVCAQTRWAIMLITMTRPDAASKLRN